MRTGPEKASFMNYLTILEATAELVAVAASLIALS